MNLTGQTAEALRQQIFQRWTELASEPARSGQPEGLMLEVISYISGLFNQSVQRGLEQNLITYARGDALDNLALFWGLTRLTGETDDQLRDRILLAPASLSRVGTTDGFLSIVKGVDPLIIDVTAIAPNPPDVEIRVLTSEGLPSPTLLAKVQAALLDKRNKPVILNPTALAPTALNVVFSGTVDIYTTADAATIPSRCADAVNKVFTAIRSRIGRDVVVKQLEAAMMSVSGVYSASVITPAQTIIVPATSWANVPIALSSDITIGQTQTG